jgi:hypothetical protein
VHDLAKKLIATVIDTITDASNASRTWVLRVLPELARVS